MGRNRWLDYARELYLLAQAGRTYANDPFDRERYDRLLDIAAEMTADLGQASPERVKDLFRLDTGYATPKLATRAAIINDGKILLVRENDGRWAMPGGWCDANHTLRENTIKEVREEAGIDVRPLRLIALHDQASHCINQFPYCICIALVLCESAGGSFQPNTETIESRFYPPDDLPDLAVEKNSAEQIACCFEAYRSGAGIAEFD